MDVLNILLALQKLTHLKLFSDYENKMFSLYKTRNFKK